MDAVLLYQLKEQKDGNPSHQGRVVDHDSDQRALYLRIRQRYGTTPVALPRADWDEPPTFLVRSPRLERAE